MDKKKLIKKAKHGDAGAFGKLYESVYKELYQYALYTLRSTEDAEDAVSETVIDAFTGIKNLKKEEAFDGWIRKILINKCRKKMKDYYRPENSIGSGAYSEETDLYEEDRLPQDYEADKQEEAMDVRESFFKLEIKDRMILSMHLFFGYKTREIAEVLKINENTVRSRESRALKKLRERIQ